MRLFFIFLILATSANIALAQLGDPNKSYTRYSMVELDGEKVVKIELSNIFIFADNRRGRMLKRKYSRLINAIRVTYPIASASKAKLIEMEKEFVTLSKSDRRKYVKKIEEELKKEYTPILKKMSLYQGIVLLKLIDRQTGDTSYQLVKEIRGGFSAFFWQGIARVFGANLKTEYDEKEDDKIMEELVRMYELGLI